MLIVNKDDQKPTLSGGQSTRERHRKIPGRSPSSMQFIIAVIFAFIHARVMFPKPRAHRRI